MLTYKPTGRDFPKYDFSDHYGNGCSLQTSSLVEPECIWLGIDNANPMIMAREAAAHGVHTREMTGWVRFPVPESVLMTTRMHLTREQVAELIPVLQHFVDTGDLPKGGTPC